MQWNGSLSFAIYTQETLIKYKRFVQKTFQNEVFPFARFDDYQKIAIFSMKSHLNKRKAFF